MDIANLFLEVGDWSSVRTKALETNLLRARTKASLSRVITEMEEYEREVLYPLATEQIEIDLDDGVKENYPKFDLALKKISDLDEKEDD
jgi:hypothetical protein